MLRRTSGLAREGPGRHLSLRCPPASRPLESAGNIPPQQYSIIRELIKTGSLNWVYEYFTYFYWCLLCICVLFVYYLCVFLY